MLWLGLATGALTVVVAVASGLAVIEADFGELPVECIACHRFREKAGDLLRGSAVRG